MTLPQFRVKLEECLTQLAHTHRRNDSKRASLVAQPLRLEHGAIGFFDQLFHSENRAGGSRPLTPHRRRIPQSFLASRPEIVNRRPALLYSFQQF